MDYRVPQYAVAVPAAGTSSTKIGFISVVIVAVIISLAALGVGLGVGLGRSSSSSNSNSGSSSGSSGNSSNTYSILSAPSVTCTYGGSSTCGCSATQPSFLTPRIYQGYTAVTNSWPWIVALFLNNNRTFCGGFLISYQYVVTAAHCVNGVAASTIIVFAGIQQLSQLSSGQSRLVSNLTVNPSYSSTAFTNDIAVLKLVSAFDETSTVGQCCLTFDTSLPSIGTHGVIAGWGESSTSNTDLSDNLLQGVIEVETFSSCSTSGTSDGRFCAGYNGTNACYGDSGSPFMISLNNSWTCAGLVSASVKCGGPTTYTQVSAFQSFISNAISTL
jgi:trypsin